MNDSGIAISANDSDKKFTKLIVDGLAEKNMKLVDGIATLMRNWRAAHPDKIKH
jgi:hypothetical protein